MKVLLDTNAYLDRGARRCKSRGRGNSAREFLTTVCVTDNLRQFPRSPGQTIENWLRTA